MDGALQLSFDDFSAYLDLILGSLYMTGIGLVIFIYAIFLLRLAKTRIHLKRPFDFVILMLIGSVLSRPINGGAPLIPTLLTTLAMILCHRAFSWITFQSRWFGNVLKGQAQSLVSDGKIDWDIIKKSKVTEEDLLEEARKNKIDELKTIKKAYLERDGNISFIE